MNMDRIKNNMHYVVGALFVVSAVLVGLTVDRVSAYVISSNQIIQAVSDAKTENGHDEETIKKFLAEGREAADKLKKKNMFVPPPPKPNPPVCFGIIGGSAIINGKQYKAGDKVAGAEIISVGAKEVTIKWEDKEMKLVPFARDNKTPQGSRSAPKAKSDQGKKKGQPSQKTPTTVVSQGPGQGVRAGGGFFNMSSEERQRLMQQYRSMSPEQQRSFRDGQRQRFMSEGGGRRGGFRGGGPRGRGRGR